MAFDENILYASVSIILSILAFFIIRFIINNKLRNLQGTQKLLGIITIGIFTSEFVYLGFQFNLFGIASEIIASVGVAFALVVWSLQNNLKNTVAGIEIYLNPEINVGDTIEVKEKKGVIIEIHLTKIVALTEDGTKIFIPCQKVVDDVFFINHKTRKSKSR